MTTSPWAIVSMYAMIYFVSGRMCCRVAALHVTATPVTITPSVRNIGSHTRASVSTREHSPARIVSLVCIVRSSPWWRHQMETFSVSLAICAGNSPVPCEFPAQRPVTRSFDVFFDLRLNNRFSKQSWGWWFETLSRPLWRHCNGYITPIISPVHSHKS